MYAADYVLVGLGWEEPIMQLLLHVTCSCIRSFFSIYFDIFELLGTFLIVFSLSLSLSLSLSVYVSLLLWHPNVNLLCPETLFVPGHLLLLILLLSLSGSVMRRPKRTSLRTFPDEAFIQNAKSFCQTSLTLTFLLSSTVGNRGHYVMSQSPVHPC